MHSEFKLPLLEVRPQACGILRNLPVDEPAPLPPHSGLIPSPYFKDCTDPEKRFIAGQWICFRINDAIFISFTFIIIF